MAATAKHSISLLKKKSKTNPSSPFHVLLVSYERNLKFRNCKSDMLLPFYTEVLLSLYIFLRIVCLYVIIILLTIYITHSVPKYYVHTPVLLF